MQCLSRSTGRHMGRAEQASEPNKQVAKARFQKAYKSLVALYDRITELDGRFDQIVRQRLPPKERAEALAPIQAALRSYMTQFLDDELDLLAHELQLTPPHSAAGDRK